MEKIEVSSYVAKGFQAAEAIKTFRTNLLFSGEEVRVIGMTSFSASQGKSTLSFQLAASLAQIGKRVLLLDADLRKSSLQNRLKVPGKVTGLSHYLIGRANVNETLFSTDVTGLYIAFAGARVPNAAELLGGARFKKLIPALKDTFDYVIVDGAPLGQVIDSAVIAPVLDGTVIVLDAEDNSLKLERHVQKQLERTGGKILGVVVNRVNMQEKHRYYGKPYGYGKKRSNKYNYGYGFGYGYYGLTPYGSYGPEAEEEESELPEIQG